eukprot:Nk52_evm76s230 gene=Nk52_evmTU76s230
MEPMRKLNFTPGSSGKKKKFQKEITKAKGRESGCSKTSETCSSPGVAKFVKYITTDYILRKSSAKNLQDITVLNLSNTAISSSNAEQKIHFIENLNELVNLKSLNLSGNKIERIEKLNKLGSLRELDLSYNQITRIENLEGLSLLTKLCLSGNLIVRLPESTNLFYRNLIRLSSLRLDRNQLTTLRDIKRLSRFDQLTCLTLEGNPFTEEAVSYEGYVIFHLSQLDLLNGRPVTSHDREGARGRYEREELQLAGRELVVAHSLCDELRQEVSQLEERVVVEQEKNTRLVDKNAELSEENEVLKTELESTKGLLAKKTNQLSKAMQKHYELEQELAFYKIDRVFDPESAGLDGSLSQDRGGACTQLNGTGVLNTSGVSMASSMGFLGSTDKQPTDEDEFGNLSESPYIGKGRMSLEGMKRRMGAQTTPKQDSEREVMNSTAIADDNVASGQQATDLEQQMAHELETMKSQMSKLEQELAKAKEAARAARKESDAVVLMHAENLRMAGSEDRSKRNTLTEDKVKENDCEQSFESIVSELEYYQLACKEGAGNEISQTGLPREIEQNDEEMPPTPMQPASSAAAGPRNKDASMWNQSDLAILGDSMKLLKARLKESEDVIETQKKEIAQLKATNPHGTTASSSTRDAMVNRENAVMRQMECRKDDFEDVISKLGADVKLLEEEKSRLENDVRDLRIKEKKVFADIEAKKKINTSFQRNGSADVNEIVVMDRNAELIHVNDEILTRTMQMKQLTRDLELLSKERDQLDGFVHSEETRYADLTKEINALQGRLGEVSSILDKKESDLARVSSLCETKLHDLKELDVELDCKINNILTNEGRLRDMEENAELLRVQQTEISVDMENKKREAERYGNQAQSLRKEILEMEKIADRHNGIILDSERQAEEAQQQLQNVKKEHEETNAKVESALNHLNEVQAQLKELEYEAKNEKASFENAQTVIKRLGDERENITADIDRLNVERSSLEKKVSDLNEKIDQRELLTKEIEKLKEKKENFEREILDNKARDKELSVKMALAEYLSRGDSEGNAPCTDDERYFSSLFGSSSNMLSESVGDTEKAKDSSHCKRIESDVSKSEYELGSVVKTKSDPVLSLDADNGTTEKQQLTEQLNILEASVNKKRHELDQLNMQLDQLNFIEQQIADKKSELEVLERDRTHAQPSAGEFDPVSSNLYSAKMSKELAEQTYREIVDQKEQLAMLCGLYQNLLIRYNKDLLDRKGPHTLDESISDFMITGTDELKTVYEHVFGKQKEKSYELLKELTSGALKTRSSEKENPSKNSEDLLPEILAHIQGLKAMLIKEKDHPEVSSENTNPEGEDNKFGDHTIQLTVQEAEKLVSDLCCVKKRVLEDSQTLKALQNEAFSLSSDFEVLKSVSVPKYFSFSTQHSESIAKKNRKGNDITSPGNVLGEINSKINQLMNSSSYSGVNKSKLLLEEAMEVLRSDLIAQYDDIVIRIDCSLQRLTGVQEKGASGKGNGMGFVPLSSSSSMADARYSTFVAAGALDFSSIGRGPSGSGGKSSGIMTLDSADTLRKKMEVLMNSLNDIEAKSTASTECAKESYLEAMKDNKELKQDVENMEFQANLLKKDISNYKVTVKQLEEHVTSLKDEKLQLRNSLKNVLALKAEDAERLNARGDWGTSFQQGPKDVADMGTNTSHSNSKDLGVVREHVKSIREGHIDTIAELQRQLMEMSFSEKKLTTAYRKEISSLVRVYEGKVESLTGQCSRLREFLEDERKVFAKELLYRDTQFKELQACLSKQSANFNGNRTSSHCSVPTSTKEWRRLVGLLNDAIAHRDEVKRYLVNDVPLNHQERLEYHLLKDEAETTDEELKFLISKCERLSTTAVESRNKESDFSIGDNRYSPSSCNTARTKHGTLNIGTGMNDAIHARKWQRKACGPDAEDPEKESPSSHDIRLNMVDGDPMHSFSASSVSSSS